MNVLVLDIEPTGVSKTNDKIIVIGLCYSFIDKTNGSQRVASHCSLSRCAHRADHDRDLHPDVIGVDVADESDVSRKLISPIQVATVGVSSEEGLEDGNCDRKKCHIFVAVTANVILRIILPFADALIVVDFEVGNKILKIWPVEKIIDGGALPVPG